MATTATTTRSKLPGLARAINRITQLRHAGDVVELGRLLTDAKKQLKRRQFRAWLTRNIDHSSSQCSKAITAFRRLAPHLSPEALAKLYPSATREMCRLRVDKEPGMMWVLDGAARQSQTRLRTEEALSLLGFAGGVGSASDPTTHRSAELTTDLKSGGKRRRTEFRFSQYQQAQTTQQLADLLSDGWTLMLSQDDIDADFPDAPRAVRVTATGPVGQRVVDSTRTLEQLIAKLSGNEMRKMCPKCGVEKSLDMFSLKTSWCKPCERRRVKDYDLKCKGKTSKSALPTPSPAKVGSAVVSG